MAFELHQIAVRYLDAKAVRERLNAISLAISALQESQLPNRHRLAAAATQALRDIASLVGGDEADQYGTAPSPSTQQRRRQVRSTTGQPAVSQDGAEPATSGPNVDKAA